MKYISAGLVIMSILSVAGNNVADAIYFLVLAIWIEPKGDA